mgnify:FL=1
MKSRQLLILFYISIFFYLNVAAQDASMFYATMHLDDALKAKGEFPTEIEIIEQNSDEAVVLLTELGGHEIHERVLVHGPGYIYKSSLEEALSALATLKPIQKNTFDYSITESETVMQVLDVINTQNIEDHIIELENYGTRFHTKPEAVQAANDLKTKWEAMAAAYNRTDVSVRLFNHVNTGMPSVIMTIEGSELPEEFVVVGGHLDSTASPSNDNAPGADDDASGIATMTEAVRALFEIDFTPKRTIEVMAYAAEEIGLVGSAEIAQEYNNNEVDVVAVGQFDMRLYRGSTSDIAFITDYTDSTLTSFLMTLIDTYNTSGAHQFTYTTSVCNYGCSDHASWTNQGYSSAFPFEARFGEHNPFIHSPGDTYNFVGSATQPAKFAKLCAEFLIETAKSNNSLNIADTPEGLFQFYAYNNQLYYDTTNVSFPIESIEIFDINGRKILTETRFQSAGIIHLDYLKAGFYVAKANVNNDVITKKIILN